jgi:hypothetical protein
LKYSYQKQRTTVTQVYRSVWGINMIILFVPVQGKKKYVILKC